MLHCNPKLIKNQKRDEMRKIVANALLRVVIRAYKLDDTM